MCGEKEDGARDGRCTIRVAVWQLVARNGGRQACVHRHSDGRLGVRTRSKHRAKMQLLAMRSLRYDVGYRKG